MRSSRRDRSNPEHGVGGDGPITSALSVTGEESCSVHEGLRKLVQLLPQVTRGLRRRPSTPVLLEEVGLGPRHGAALSLLREYGPLTVGRLAAELGLTLATVSGVVADLERAGFVDRSADPSDRRRTIVVLSAGRCAVVDAWLEGATAPIVRALDKLSAAERATFVKAMEYLEAELNAGSDGRAPDRGCGNHRAGRLDR